jgi:type VI secretion system protein ImpG
VAEPKPQIEPTLYEDFLAEMRALDEFRAHLSSRHPEARLRRDDPDVRRLLEATAYFTVRSRRHLVHNMEATWLRLFSDQFDPLLTTLPAAALVEAVVHPRRADVAVLPRGTALHLSDAQGRAGSFRTLDDLRVLPIEIQSAVLLQDPGGKYQRIAIELVSRFARREEVGLLRLHTRVVDDYAASASLLYQLRAHLLRAHVVFDSPRSAEQMGETCGVSYGSVYEPLQGMGSGGQASGPETTHPLERTRSFFHFPERELFINLAVPLPHGIKSWQRLTIYLDLSADWPRRTIDRDLFHLHTVPVCNIRREWAMPVTCDGTQDALPIRHPNPEHGFALRSVLGVYVARESGLVPLRTSLLPEPPEGSAADMEPAEDGPGYQIEERQTPSGARPYLVVRAPAALLQPLRLHVDALWYQPGFAERVFREESPLSTALAGRTLEGIGWAVLGGLRAEGSSPLRGDVSSLLRILSMSMRPVLNESELRWLMQLLIGSTGPAVYRRLPSRLQGLRWSLSPDSALRGSGTRHIYSLQLPIEPGDLGEDEAIVHAFLCWVHTVLDVWNQDSTVDLKVDAGETVLKLRIPPSGSAEGSEPHG